MNIRKKLSLIVFLSVFLTTIPASFFISYYAKERVLLKETSNLIANIESHADIISNQLSQSKPKLEGFSRLLKKELSKPIDPNEINQFHQAMELGSDRVWRNRRNTYNGMIESGIFLPPNTAESDLQKITHLRIKHVMDYFGAAADKLHENIWYLSNHRSEVIFDTTFPSFVFDQAADNDYTQTPWVKYTSPELNPNRTFSFSPPLFDPVPKVWMISALYPLYFGNKWLGTLGEDMQLSSVLGVLFKTHQLYPETEHFLIDNKDNFILAGQWQSELERHTDNRRIDLHIPPELAVILKFPLLEKATLLTKSLHIGDRDFIAIGISILPVNWRYVRLVPVDSIVKPAQQLLFMLVIFVFVISAFCGGLINVAVNKYVVSRIRLLIENMRFYEFGKKQHVYHELLGSDEISLVAQEFDLMIDRTEKHRLTAEKSKQILLESGERWALAIEGAGDGVWDWNILTNHALYSPRWKSMLGYAEHEVKDNFSEWERLVHPDDKEASLFKIEEFLTKKNTQYESEFRMLHKDGHYINILSRGFAVEGKAGKITRMVGTHVDITVRKRIEEKLKLAAKVFTHAREAITITDAAGTILDVNDTFTLTTGYSREEAIGQNPRILQSGRQSPEFYTEMWKSLVDEGYWYGEVWNRHKNGEVYAEMKTISAVHDEQGAITHYVALCTDITPMKRHQEQIERIAHYDILTDLPNRSLLADRLNQSMMQCSRHKQSLAVVFLDLDGFKAVNDTYGHDVGDELLISLSTCMKEALREGDTLARIGGDEFVAVLADLAKIEDCEPVLKRLLLAASEPVTIDEIVLNVSASIGVTLYPQDSADADQLMRHSDQAMYVAKQAGKNRYHFFDTKQDEAGSIQRESLDNIRSALERREFVLHYQPKVNMRTGTVIGVEALIRWQHPSLGLLSPADFLPIVEGHTISLDIGKWVIDTALTQISQWKSIGIHIPISVNISAYQLQQGECATCISALLTAHPEVDPSDLEIEILETSALDDVQHASTVMNACMALGVKFALDDFGTGYSSLTHLRRLPVDLIKIDQTFVRDMLADTDDLAIVEGVIALAKSFKRDVIAEGVETVEHGTLLLQLGCDLAQGYGIARPMSASDIPVWVKDWKPDDAWRSDDIA